MDCEKKIEIPFGAFDSELIRQEINIPKGFKATIEGDKIILTRTEREDEKVRKALAEMVHDTTGDELWVDYNVHKEEALAWLEKQGEQKHADTVEPKCEESKTKIFDAPTPFEDKLYAFVLACEILVDPSKREFILEHSQEILDAAREQIGKEQSSTWSKEDEKEYKYVLKFVDNILNNCGNKKDYEHCKRCYDWLKSLKDRYTWKPSDEQIEALDSATENCAYSEYQDCLRELIGQLKKLREE